MYSQTTKAFQGVDNNKNGRFMLQIFGETQLDIKLHKTVELVYQYCQKQAVQSSLTPGFNS